MLIWHPLSTNDLTIDASVVDAADNVADFFFSENLDLITFSSHFSFLRLTVVLTLPEFVSLSESVFNDLQFCPLPGDLCFECVALSNSKLVSLNEKSSVGSVKLKIEY